MSNSLTKGHVREGRRNAEASNRTVPKRPAPTPEQIALGIRPPAFGNGTSADIDDLVKTFTRLGDEEFQSFLKAIADNRADRRATTSERTD